MAESTWYLGPLGYLRPLRVPNKDGQDNQVRYGATHTGLFGGKTVDFLGQRSEIRLDFDFLLPEELEFLRALNSRHLPGPLALLRPGFRNRLSEQASSLWRCYTAQEGPGIYFNGMGRTMEFDFPPGLLGVQSYRVPTFSTTAYLHFDGWMMTPLKTPGEQLTGSIYLKAQNAGQSVNLLFEWFDRVGEYVSTTTTTIPNLATTWTRYSHTASAPAGAARARFRMSFNNVVSVFNLAAPQVEEGPVATTWQLGGGSAFVSVDSLATTLPQYPYSNGSLSLLEI